MKKPGLSRRPRREEEMAEEMSLHLQHRIEQNLAAGMTHEEARHAALRRFGGVPQAQEQCRDQRRWSWLAHFWKDVREGGRGLRKSPGFTAVALVTLALGIGANTAIFSLVKSVLLRPLPYPHAEELAAVWERQKGVEVASLSWGDLQQFQAENQSFAALAGYRVVSYSLTGEGDPEQLAAAQVSASMFTVIGLKPQLGRYFTAAEDIPRAPNLAVLTYGLWKRRFGGDARVVGRQLTLDNRAFTVTGVLPAEYQAPSNAEFVTQLGIPSGNPGWHLRTTRPGIFVIGRLKAGIAWPRALADLRRVAARIEHDHPESNRGVTVAGQSLLENAVGSYRRGLEVLLGAVGLVLLIACGNLANLLLARGLARETEFAVRAALGASRGRIVRQLLTENLLLALGGGALGAAMTLAARRGIAALSPAGVERFQQARIDSGVLAVTFVLSILTVVIFGAGPAWKAARTNLRAAMETGGRGGSGGRSHTRGRELLVVGEVALTLVLLAGAGLLIKSLVQAQAVDLGFEAQGVITARMKTPNQNAYDTQLKSRALNERVLARLAAQPGVVSAELAGAVPLAPMGRYSTYFVDGEPANSSGAPSAELNLVSGGYFQTLGIAMLRGRTFGPEDTMDSPRVAIVDQGLAARHWPGQDPVGKTLRLGGEPLITIVNHARRDLRAPLSPPVSPDEVFRVVGVVKTVRLYGYAAEARLPQIYASATQFPPNDTLVVVKVRGKAAAMASVVRRGVQEADPKQPVMDLRTLEERVNATFATSRLYTFLMTIFAGLALLLAMVGLYGVLAYDVSCRRREFGIRVALGAWSAQITLMVLRRGLRLIAAGCAVGLAGALALGRVMGAMLYQTSAFDGVVIAGVSLGLMLVALAASWLPARRAARTAPLDALRA